MNSDKISVFHFVPDKVVKYTAYPDKKVAHQDGECRVKGDYNQNLIESFRKAFGLLELRIKRAYEIGYLMLVEDEFNDFFEDYVRVDKARLN